ncbi:hypothetical protein ACFWUP_07980 [Nocardia sp. NPDC058658]|uniref:RskA family anti-sigma factor n=1 Tax=Nocardia sp. NPDC058658 TaxID=3346580 RepID=UPI0036496763
MSGQRGPGSIPGVRGAATRAPDIGADDREEMRELYRATGAAAFGLALRVLHRRGAAEDVVREGYRRARDAQWIVDEDDRESDSRPAEFTPDRAQDPVSRPGPDLGTPWGRSAFVATEQRSDLVTPTYGSMDIAFGRGVVYTHDGTRVPADHADADPRSHDPGSLDAGYPEFRHGGADDHPGPHHRGPADSGLSRPDLIETATPGADHGSTRAERPDIATPGFGPLGAEWSSTGHPGTELPGTSHTATDIPAFTPDQSWLLAQIHRLAVQRLRLDRRGGDDMPWLAAAARLGFDDPLDSRCEIFVLAYYGGRTYRAIGRELGLRVPMVTRLLAEGIERLAEQRIDRWTATQSWCPPGSVLSLADAYALDAVAELEQHHIEAKLTATTPNSLSQFASRVRGVHEVLARLAADDQHTPPRNLETRILADLGAAPPRRGHWTARPPWLRRFGGGSES